MQVEDKKGATFDLLFCKTRPDIALLYRTISLSKSVFEVFVDRSLLKVVLTNSKSHQARTLKDVIFLVFCSFLEI